MSDFNLILTMARQDPLLIVGLFLLGFHVWLSMIVLRRLLGSGYKPSGFIAMWPMIGTMPLAYLHLRDKTKHGWSPWTAYLIWVTALAGIAALVAGLFRLPG